MTFCYRDTAPMPSGATPAPDGSAAVRGSVHVGFTDRGLDFGDAADEATRNRALTEVAQATRRQPVVMRQVHGADVAWVGDEWPAVGRGGPDGRRDPPRVDALVTGRTDVALVTRAADCVPVLLAGGGLIAAVHAGRLGVHAAAVPAAVAQLRSHGVASIVAWIGPHVCGQCYEVPDQMRAEVAAAVPATYATTRTGTPSLDLGAGVRSQLEAADCAVREVGRCTYEDRELHSHRRDADAAGRLAGVIWWSW